MPSRHVVLPEGVPAPLAEGFARAQREAQVPDDFPADVLAAAEQAVAAPRLPETDRTDLELVTIDPPGAKDLDQAVFIRRLDSGFEVFYAIADVAAFVTPGDPIDLEAHRRGQTFYAPGRRTPLHPPLISENHASLLPGQVRPALLWHLVLDADGVCEEPKVSRALVRSREQLTYQQVQDMIDDASAPESLMLLRTVGLLREKLEQMRGGVSLNIPEQEVEAVDGTWQLTYRSALPVEGWNAQISLMTGIAAAELMLYAQTGVLRTLPPADGSSLRRLHTIARALEIPWPAEMEYPEFVRSLDPTDPKHAAMQFACTTLFRGAGYVAFTGSIPEQVEHAALATEYAHTTAPLRRLVDRYVLEICAAICADQPIPQWVEQALEQLPEEMAESTRRASKYERMIVDLCETLVLSPRLGETFTATVVEADTERKRGRIMIADLAVEAMVRGDRLPLGEMIRVRLTGVDLLTGESTFEIVG
ncbi:RNB domain-containing ribonuclease [Granulicoccus phenolivorans]|uniref:RNB domain-containing ribonuclease n=1 Tax=Granulicoccus phenolivorans TaxID=266854 RepID=UPI00041049CB|nr:RNB domain-containing ribonuclease [Granulicoccus phenolivorans]